MNQTRTIFLDVDGVLNSYLGHLSKHGLSEVIDERIHVEKKLKGITYWYEEPLLGLLLWLIEETGAKIVGISSWFNVGDDSHNQMLAKFLGIDEVFLGTTDYTGGGLPRGDSVLRYVEEHELQHWCVIDDAGGGMYQFPTVNVNGRIGLTGFDVNTAKDLLDGFHSVQLYKLMQKMGSN
ncbi:hypothetical protein My1_100 [Pectobacterium phage My1]|uniref:Uncharacterized protein n=1 Tax=Pectobacterium phage My1 TaxID=1204539 RepID=J9QL03_9CAUD|nr:hypothetical protein My1_100 [Pectobacterium phage My1]AFQ22259.1 hypothetical protein My1_100 [Pectobacterium phage My1]